MDGRLLDVVLQEGGKLRQETVGGGFAIDRRDDGRVVQVVFLHELLAQVLRQLLLQHIAHEQLAQHGTAALIAQDVSQGRHIHHHLLAVVVARVAARTQDAGDTRLATAHGTRGGKQVAGDLHLAGTGQVGTQGIDHLLLDFVRDDACAIVVDLVNLVVGEVRHQLTLDLFLHLLLGEQEGVHAGSENLSYLLFSVKQCPVDLGGTAVSNKNHHNILVFKLLIISTIVTIVTIGTIS